MGGTFPSSEEPLIPKITDRISFTAMCRRNTELGKTAIGGRGLPPHTYTPMCTDMYMYTLRVLQQEGPQCFCWGGGRAGVRSLFLNTNYFLQFNIPTGMDEVQICCAFFADFPPFKKKPHIFPKHAYTLPIMDKSVRFLNHNCPDHWTIVLKIKTGQLQGDESY